MKNFELKMVSQGFLENDEGYDLCSHGQIRFKIGNTLLSGENDDWTISTAGFMLLKTLQPGYSATQSGDVIFDHCGQLEMLGCPISLTWDIQYDQNKMTISNIKKIPGTDGLPDPAFQGLVFQVDPVEYYRSVIRFCDDVLHFFSHQKELVFEKEKDRLQYEMFREGFNRLLAKTRENFQFLKKDRRP